jgi:hypothetical protein
MTLVSVETGPLVISDPLFEISCGVGAPDPCKLRRRNPPEIRIPTTIRFRANVLSRLTGETCEGSLCAASQAQHQYSAFSAKNGV